jgi:hypothetical protein
VERGGELSASKCIPRFIALDAQELWGGAVNSGSMVEAVVEPAAGSAVRCGRSCGASKLQRSPSAGLRAGFRFAQDDNLVGVIEIGEFQNSKARARRRFHADGVALHGELGVCFRAG